MSPLQYSQNDELFSSGKQQSLNITMLSPRYIPSESYKPVFDKLADEIFQELGITNPDQQTSAAMVNIICNAYKIHNLDAGLDFPIADNMFPKIHSRYGIQCDYSLYYRLFQQLSKYRLIKCWGEIHKWYLSLSIVQFDLFESINEELLTIIKGSKSRIIIPAPLSRLKPACFVILKDADNNWIDYKFDPLIYGIEVMLACYNMLMESVEVLLDSDLVCHIKSVRKHVISKKKPLSQKLDSSLFRVFSEGAFNRGGRYLAEYQQLSPEQRGCIRINNQATVEISYDEMRLRMCYHLLKKEYDKDPYDLFDGNPELIQALKEFINVALSEETLQSAIKRFEDLAGGSYADSNTERLWCDIFNVLQNETSASELYERFIEHHPELVSFIATDKCSELEFFESQIATDIIRHLTIENNIPCLCIYDSFIVPVQYKDDLIKVMEETYKSHMGFNCPTVVIK